MEGQCWICDEWQQLSAIIFQAGNAGFLKMLLVIHHERPMLISMGLMAWYQHLFSLGRKPFDLKAAYTAAESGDPEAQFALGLNYCGESGVAPDFERAVQWLRKAADQDHAQAQVHLAAMLV